MRWVEGKNQWHMETVGGVFVQEFYSCAVFNRLFRGLDKNKVKVYEVIVEEVDGC